MRLLETGVERRRDAVRLRGLVEREASGDRIEVYADYGVGDAAMVGNAADAFAAAILIPAMRAGERLSIAPPVSPRLCFSLPRIRDLFHAWWPHFARVDLELVPAADGGARPPARAATFFSGGVDSFYSLLKNRHGHGAVPAPMTHLIHMRGVETRLELTRGAAQTEAWIREIASAAGVEAIAGENNFRTALQGPEEYLHWETHYFGSALASIALGLSPGFAYICIPASYSYNHLVPVGSSPVLDEMFSTERLQIVHEGAEASRPVRVARILEWNGDLVLNYLRVCLLNGGGPTNCGRCKKCVRTAVPLWVLGVWDRAATFPDKRTGHWEDTIVQDHLVLIEENLQFAREHGDGQVVAMLERAIRRKRRRDAAKALLGTRPLRPLRPAAARARDLLRRRPSR